MSIVWKIENHNGLLKEITGAFIDEYGVENELFILSNIDNNNYVQHIWVWDIHKQQWHNFSEMCHIPTYTLTVSQAQAYCTAIVNEINKVS